MENEYSQNIDKHTPKGMKRVCLGDANGLCSSASSSYAFYTHNIYVNNYFRFTKISKYDFIIFSVNQIFKRILICK